MGNEIEIGWAKQEIGRHDQWHKTVAMVLTIIIVGLSIAHNITNQPALIDWIPILTIGMLGVIIRLETTVHRIGAYLDHLFDEWEAFREGLLYDKLYLSIADLFIMVPVGVCLIYFYQNTQQPTSLLNMTYGVIIVAEVILWASAPSMVKKLRANSGS